MLSKECLNEIEKVFPDNPQVKVSTIGTILSYHEAKRQGAKTALTTPQIYESAGLVKKEDTVGYTREQVDSAFEEGSRFGFAMGADISDITETLDKEQFLASLPQPQQVIPLDEALAFAEWMLKYWHINSIKNTTQLYKVFKQETHGKY